MSNQPPGPPSDPWSSPPPPPTGGFAPPPPPPPSPSASPSAPPTAGSWGGGYGSAPRPPGGYASWGQRVGATLLDALFSLIAYVPALIFVAADVVALAVLFYLLAAVVQFYFAYLTGSTGQSPGKRVVGITVLKEATNQPIGGGMGIARMFVHIIDGLPIYLGYLWPLWDEKRQTFTDKLLGTVVYQGVPKRSFGVDLFKP